MARITKVPIISGLAKLPFTVQEKDFNSFANDTIKHQSTNKINWFVD